MKKANKSAEKLEKLLHQAVAQRDWREVVDLAGDLFLMKVADGAKDPEDEGDMYNDWSHLLGSTREI